MVGNDFSEWNIVEIDRGNPGFTGEGNRNWIFYRHVLGNLHGEHGWNYDTKLQHFVSILKIIF